MFFLLKRKDELGNVMKIDEDDPGLQTFVADLDLVNRCVFSLCHASLRADY